MTSRWREEGCILLTAFSYFSRLPTPVGLQFTPQRLAASGRYFPVVGLVIGAIGAGVMLGAAQVWSLAVAILLAMGAMMLASGALHEDGLADCCDAFGGAHTREDILRIMKDSRIGAFGTIGLGLTLALKWQLLNTIAAHSLREAAIWLIVAQAASRAAAITYVATLDYARDDGKASAFQRTDAPRDIWSTGIALLFGLPALFWSGWALGFVCLALGVVLHRLLGRWLQKRLGGYTGDCLGLAQQMFEAMVLMTVSAWISF